MSRQKALLAVTVLFLALAVVHADSPLTDSDFAKAYMDLPAVKEALATKTVAGEVLRLLLSDEPNDRKAAVVNALGWVTPDKFAPSKAAAFLTGLAAARKIPLPEIKLAQLTPPDRFVFGYLRAMDTYSDPAPLRPGMLDIVGATPYQLLAQAAQALPDDFAVQYVRAMVDAQTGTSGTDSAKCASYRGTQAVLDKFPEKQRNLRQAAVASVQTYMALYKDYCTAAAQTPAATASTLTGDHNRLYSIARLGETIVAGTHGGIVVWQPSNRQQPLATRNERICSAVLAWHDAVWAGCSGIVVRWDGTTWKAYPQDPALADAPFVPLLGPAGELLVRTGARVWRYDSERDTFSPFSMTLGANPLHVMYRRNGELWRTEFLKGIVGPTRTFAIKSAEYPGGDPQKLVEDGAGRLWVTDYSSGVFRLDAAGARFELQPGLTQRASGVAIDAQRGRTWLLHHNFGPTLVAPPNPDRPITTRNLQFMTDMLVEESTGSVWVAGWSGLVRLREEKGRFLNGTYQIRVE